MLSISYRRFALSDWERVRALLSHEGEASEHDADVLASQPAEAWLAMEGDQVVGWVLTRPLLSEDGVQRGGVEDIVVARTQRGRGVGRHLMELAESHYRQRGFGGMQLNVRADNEPARRLYESMGYAIVQHRLRMSKQFR
jgi:ribosomal protein S18 acetylase RimI-like enzyme